MIFVKFSGKLFYRNLLATTSNLMLVFASFIQISEICYLPKINLFGEAMVNKEKEFTSSLMMCSYGNQMETSW